MKLIFAEPLVVLFDESLRRGVNGMLHRSPRVFALRYSDEQDTISCLPVDWEAAEALAPAPMAKIRAELERLRTSE